MNLELEIGRTASHGIINIKLVKHPPISLGHVLPFPLSSAISSAQRKTRFGWKGTPAIPVSYRARLTYWPGITSLLPDNSRKPLFRPRIANQYRDCSSPIVPGGKKRAADMHYRRIKNEQKTRNFQRDSHSRAILRIERGSFHPFDARRPLIFAPGPKLDHH